MRIPAQRHDRLGMNEPISRRDFLNGALLAGAGLLLNGKAATISPADAFNGYGGVSYYSHSNGNTWEVLSTGHALRDGAFEQRVADAVHTGEMYDLVAVRRGGRRRLEGVPISESVHAELPRCGTKRIDVPGPTSEGDAMSRQRDAITLEDHLMARYDISRGTVRQCLSPVEGGGYGLGPDVLSAYCNYAIENQFPEDGDDTLGDQMFPD